MVWGLFPVDPLPGEESYYFFCKGTYKVGRKGCDIIVNKDKGVSRVHAEMVFDEMVSIDNTKKKSCGIRIRDCSKYGTFVKKPVGSKEKVHEFPNKEMILDDEDLISFGTGNATYRFTYVPLVFFICGLEPVQIKEVQVKILSIGTCMTTKWGPNCTHVLLGDNVSLNADVVDAVMSRKHFISYKWIEILADKRIGTQIPSCSSYAPTLTLQEVSVKVSEPESRENCLSGYTFLLESSDKYKAKKKLQPLLESFGAKVDPAGEYIPHSQGLEDDENTVVHVISAGEGYRPEYSHNLSSVPKVTEVNLICATLSGRIDPAVFVSPPVLVTSSCSTDETVVADSEPEVEITSMNTSSAIHKTEPICLESIKHDSEGETASHIINTTKFDDQGNTTTYDTILKSKESQRDDKSLIQVRKTDDADLGTSTIIFSQDLIIRDTNLLSSVPSQTNNLVLNFKRFRKMGTESGNSLHNIVPFSKHPYKGSEYENEEVAESLKEEKKRKQREAVAEDLFNKTKAKQRGAAGFLSGLFTGR
uniref:nijmegen breakage syndrome 1 protein n=1 Tax=Erigeron canadensis TaxID=72917 RepID=UPI001CB99DB3|nr:nijmegen breakage syndrome 1 protein [Erigeron canadensis]XP_043640192.1 nijmegen breakage syndrome 1 protein [Erigeron canadensis]XP_043640193.1 nijmegen breakage syndrome 1 protein [Erigeron canadensis]